jgi:hypothetical protein
MIPATELSHIGAGFALSAAVRYPPSMISQVVSVDFQCGDCSLGPHGEPHATNRVPQMSFMWKYAEDNATETPETETNPATVSHSAHPHAPRAR